MGRGFYPPQWPDPRKAGSPPGAAPKAPVPVSETTKHKWRALLWRTVPCIPHALLVVAIVLSFVFLLAIQSKRLQLALEPLRARTATEATRWTDHTPVERPFAWLLRQLSIPSFSSQILDAWVHDQSLLVIDQYSMVDREMLGLAQDGNVFLRFRGFDAADPDQESFLVIYYYRGAYRLYPQQILVGPRAAPINSGRDIVKVNADPDGRWLTEQRIRSVAFIERKPDGQIEKKAGAVQYGR